VRWGADVWVCSSVPSTSFNTAAMCAVFDSQKAWTMGTAAGTLGGDFPMAHGINLSDAWRDTTQDASNKRQPLTGITDGIHPDGAHRFYCASLVLSQFQALLPTYSGSLTSGCMSANPTLTGTGGSRTGGGTVTGLVATNFTATADAAGTTLTVSKNADDSQKIVLSIPSGANISTTKSHMDSAAFALPTNYGSTNYVRGVVKLRVNSQSGMSLVYPELKMSTGELYSCGQMETAWVSDAQAQGKVLILKTPPVPVSDGATTATITLWMRPTTSATNVALDIDIFAMGIEPATAS
jgi:hypothetical protein